MGICCYGAFGERSNQWIQAKFSLQFRALSSGTNARIDVLQFSLSASSLRLLRSWKLVRHNRFRPTPPQTVFVRRRRLMRLVQVIGMLALLLLTPLPESSQAVGNEWDTLNQELISLYQKGEYDR